MKDEPKTNITDEHKAMFKSLLNNEDGWCLLSCFISGAPTAAICRATRNEETDEVLVEPKFIAVSSNMKLTDHDGREPKDVGHEEEQES
jgi:hypothetical protein